MAGCVREPQVPTRDWPRPASGAMGHACRAAVQADGPTRRALRVAVSAKGPRSELPLRRPTDRYSIVGRSVWTRVLIVIVSTAARYAGKPWSSIMTTLRRVDRGTDSQTSLTVCNWSWEQGLIDTMESKPTRVLLT